jgi:alkanesulfonate monooxygenase SsuD/methylene tetrahydromethanopterin reductase-like flavin-dependent oxidoreductase (luciferase family)
MRYFYKKSLHVARHYAAVAGYTTKASIEAAIRRGGAGNPFEALDPAEVTWNELVDGTKRVIGGSPATVVDHIKELAKDLNVGHLILLMHLGSMDTELTKYSTRLFAEEVLPKIRDLWPEWEDRWWPTGARRPELAEAAAG